jgi:5-formyltetrahydrofolate cyclo-ligase
MLKADIRKLYKQKRQSLTDGERAKLEDLMLIQFQQLSLPCTHLLSFAPIQNLHEYNPFLAEEFVAFKNENLQLLYPVVQADTSMKAALINDATQFAFNRWKIAEPINPQFITEEKIDVIFVPLLGFDNRGYRVGYGKGFYDKFINLCRKDVVCIGFSYFDEIAIDDVGPHDKKLNYCVTPNKLYAF